MTALLCGTVAVALFKELRLLCFDEPFAASQGWPVLRLDIALVAIVTAISAAGLQAVGLILVVALLVIPPAAARLWTDRLTTMAIVAATMGAVSGWIGAQASALLPDLPTGPVIVLVAAAILGFSVLFGARGGIVTRTWRRRRYPHVSASSEDEARHA